MIASTLDDRAAFDARLAAGAGPHLRADDAAGQAEMRECLGRGFPVAECIEEVEARLDSRGFFCADTLHITSAGKTCGPATDLSAAQARVLLKEAEARRIAPPSRLPWVAGGLALAAAAWFVLR